MTPETFCLLRLSDRWNLYLLSVWMLLSFFTSTSVLGDTLRNSSQEHTTPTMTYSAENLSRGDVARTFHTYYHDNFSISSFEKKNVSIPSENLVLNDSRVAVQTSVRELDWVALTTPYGIRRITRTQTDDSDGNSMGSCRHFSVGDPDKKEFYSPNFPNDYGNHTDCIKTIKAEPGHLLRLDFRDEFHVEPSEGCKNDYLEVRDGPHGYSNLIGLFCGHEFPPMLTSSDRYLWLRFVSDETIQYSGFRAVYSFVPKPTSTNPIPELNLCEFERGGSEGFANRSDVESDRDLMAQTYGLSIDCMWVITVEEGWKVMLQFVNYRLHKPNDCDCNVIDVFSDRTDMPSREKNFCGSIADSVNSKSNVLYVRFFADHACLASTFSAYYTAFRDKPRDQGCNDDEYDCEDATCISIDLKCNSRNNCRYRWDEMDCKVPEGAFAAIAKSEHIIIILVVFCLILFGMCFAFVFNCTRKLVHDHRIIQEHIRQSRECELNSIGAKGSQTVLQKVTLSTRAHSHSSEIELDTRREASAGSVPVECYVPGAEVIPIFDPHRGDEEPLPEMRDTECQTRESLFATHPIDRLSDQSMSPPPPPLPSARNPKSPPNFSTFGYPKPEEKKYRAEAVIEMKEEQRPYSIQSTKSAPDVIVTH